METIISGHIIDIDLKNIYKGKITVSDGIITDIRPSDDVPDRYILPGFIDAHIHIESSMVTPYEFSKIALGHGTIATVSDPHEIANVCGMEGVSYMIENAKHAGLKFFFGAPSCVPATSFEHSGAIIDADDVDNLLRSDDIYYLSEMMNYPGVLQRDQEIMRKLESAKKHGKPIDGHAPGLTGQDAIDYIKEGISTDHECFSLDEAKHKLSHGMKIIIREGSAAKNFEALHPLIGMDPDKIMFCSDDKHPDDLMEGHINLLVKRALQLGYDFFDVLKIACINPVKHYNLPVGLLRKGDKADFIIINDTKNWNVQSVYIDGQLRYNHGVALVSSHDNQIINHFCSNPISSEKLKYHTIQTMVPVIDAIDGSLVTEKYQTTLENKGGCYEADPSRDILKICVVNRYEPDANPGIGFIRHFGIKNGAMASTVAHDSHNIIAVGTDDQMIAKAINLIIQSKGGLSFVTDHKDMIIPLPIAGLMSDQSAADLGKKYQDISTLVKENGCRLHAPFMTLSFMALLVIPKIKISDMGMFDAESFTFY